MGRTYQAADHFDQSKVPAKGGGHASKEQPPAADMRSAEEKRAARREQLLAARRRGGAQGLGYSGLPQNSTPGFDNEQLSGMASSLCQTDNKAEHQIYLTYVL